VLEKKYIVRESDVPVQHELMNNAIIDTFVDVNLVRHMFDDDAWACVMQVVAIKIELDKKELLSYYCTSCKIELRPGQLQVQCEACIQWFHVSCVPKFKTTSTRSWFCEKCKHEYDCKLTSVNVS
jgi:hypothetical protein